MFLLLDSFRSSGGMVDFSPLNAQGEMYEPFFSCPYEIVGCYRYTEETAEVMPGNTEMARDLILIPAASVTASDENNICGYGPMQDTTTSFQIENGTAAQFEEMLKKLPESRFLQVEYDDNGYEQIADSLDRVRGTAILLCAAGAFSAVAVIALLLYFFIVRQGKRTAIERGLGMTKNQCRLSLLPGIFLLTVCAGAVGSLCSQAIIGSAEIKVGGESAFSTKYSTWDKTDSGSFASFESAEQDTATAVPVVVPLALTLFTLLAGLALTERNLRIEPMRILGERGG